MPKIGDTVYQFDENRRVYRRDEKGHAPSGPIYREHFRSYAITGEEKRSWLIEAESCRGAPRKVAKGNVLTADDVDVMCWRNDHAWRLREAVGRCRDVEILKAVAVLVGYDAAAQ